MPTKDLQSSLLDLPAHWMLTAVNGKKAPYQEHWTLGRTREDIKKEIEQGRAKGYGLLTGRNSGGVVAIDCDGYAAHDLAHQLGGLPETISFTSGKPGRAQYLYQVPKEYWLAIQTVKLDTGVSEFDKKVFLELRWDGCQSVLPPSEHPETSHYTWIKDYTTPMADCPTWVIEKMLKESTTSPVIPFQKEIAIAPPLEVCISKSGRESLGGVTSGGRNDAGAKLARELIGTETRLRYLGIEYDGTARQLFDEFCQRCNPALGTREANQIWKSAEKSNPVASLTDEMIVNCAKAYQRKQGRQERKGTAIEPVKQHQEKSKNLELVTKPIIEDDLVKEELADNEYAQLPEQVLSTLLGEQLFKAHKAKAEGFGIDPAVISVGTLLLFGSQLQADHEVVINDLTDYAISPNWCAVGIGETGTMKTPIFEASFNPLATVQYKHDQKFADKMGGYQRDLADYRRCKPEDNELPPTEPTPIEVYVDNFTIESVMESLKTRANLALCSDEVTSIFNGLGQYQAGKGNSRQMLLKLLSNGAIKINRKGSGRISLQKTSIGLWGMTQPSVWSRDLLKEEAEDGLHARIALYSVPKGGRIKYSEDVIELNQRGGRVDYTAYLSDLYRQASELPATKVRLSAAARKVWQKWDDEIYQLVDCEPESKIRGLYPKGKARAAAIALGAHWLTYCQGGNHEPTEISGEILEAAIAFTKWLLSETKSLYASWGIGVGKETAKIASLLKKLKDKKTGDGWVDRRYVYRSLHISVADSEDLMTSLSQRKMVEMRGSGSKLEIRLPRVFVTCDKTTPKLSLVNDALVTNGCDKVVTKPKSVTSLAQGDKNLGDENNPSGDPSFVTENPVLSQVVTSTCDKQNVDGVNNTAVLSQCHNPIDNLNNSVTLSASPDGELQDKQKTAWEISAIIRSAIAFNSPSRANDAREAAESVPKDQILAKLTPSEESEYLYLLKLYDKKQLPVEEYIERVLTPEEQQQLSQDDSARHFKWQAETLIKTSPSQELFQQLVPVAYLGALKATLLKIDFKNGARARAINKELDRREKLESKTKSFVTAK